jgi:hypothetical protein
MRAALLLLLLAACTSSQAKRPADQRDHSSRLQLCDGASTVTRPLRPGQSIGSSDGGVDMMGANGEPVNSELGCTNQKDR